MPKKLSPEIIAADRETLRAIQQMVDYRPSNPACSVEAMLQLDATLRAAEQSTSFARADNKRTQEVLERAEDVEMNTGHMLHEVVCTARVLVVGQYGRNAYEVKAIGLTRTSDRKRPARKPKTA
jgi:hypothetical protein